MNRSRKITGILLACCALLMVSIAGLGVTMAKYVKSAPNKSDSASVAKFGVTLEWTNGDSFFKNTYATDDSTKQASITNSVVSSTDADSDDTMDNVIAPGTSGSMTLTISGTSEVAFTLTIKIQETYIGNWKESDKADAEVYHPITYTASTTGDTPITLDANGECSFDVQAGATLNSVITISWSWPFEHGENADEIAANNAADTYMSGVSGAKYQITASATATQID